jgi:hypothetical protein
VNCSFAKVPCGAGTALPPTFPSAPTLWQISWLGGAVALVENEGNNVLKTKGYHFEHNFGHGEENLSTLLLTLLLFAFLCQGAL